MLGLQAPINISPKKPPHKKNTKGFFRVDKFGRLDPKPKAFPKKNHVGQNPTGYTKGDKHERLSVFFIRWKVFSYLIIVFDHLQGNRYQAKVLGKTAGLVWDGDLDSACILVKEQQRVSKRSPAQPLNSEHPQAVTRI